VLAAGGHEGHNDNHEGLESDRAALGIQSLLPVFALDLLGERGDLGAEPVRVGCFSWTHQRSAARYVTYFAQTSRSVLMIGPLGLDVRAHDYATRWLGLQAASRSPGLFPDLSTGRRGRLEVRGNWNMEGEWLAARLEGVGAGRAYPALALPPLRDSTDFVAAASAKIAQAGV